MSDGYVLYPIDRGVLRSTSWLRLSAVVIVGMGSVLYAMQEPGLVGWVLIIMAAFACMGWLGVARKGLRRAKAVDDDHGLRFDSEGVTLRTEAGTERRAWREVTEIEVDEESLKLVFRGPNELKVDPLFPAGLHELQEEALRWRSGHSPPSRSGSSPDDATK